MQPWMLEGSSPEGPDPPRSGRPLLLPALLLYSKASEGPGYDPRLRSLRHGTSLPLYGVPRPAQRTRRGLRDRRRKEPLQSQRYRQARDPAAALDDRRCYCTQHQECYSTARLPGAQLAIEDFWNIVAALWQRQNGQLEPVPQVSLNLEMRPILGLGLVVLRQLTEGHLPLSISQVPNIPLLEWIPDQKTWRIHCLGARSRRRGASEPQRC